MKRSESTNHQELLEWQLAMGADEAIEEQAIDWFSWSLKNAPQKLTPTEPIANDPQRQTLPNLHLKPPNPAKAPSAAEPVTSSQDIVGDARKLAASCNSVDDLIKALQTFDACPLARTASNLCFIDGNRNAKVLMIGEAPEREEDLQGKPFVGRSGQLLDKIMGHIGLSRNHETNDQSVLLTNIVFWRPPGNRKPTEVEISMCMPFVTRLIEIVSPQIIVTLGATPTQRLTGETKGILRLRGRWFHYVGNDPDSDNSIPVLATLHPKRLPQQPKQKKLVWDDFISLKLRLQQML